MLSLIKTRLSKLSEVEEKMSFFLSLPEYDKELFLNKKNKISEFDTVKTVLTEALPVLEGIESFDNDTLFASLSPLGEKLSLKLGAVMWCLRIAVSGMSATPGGATEIMEVIGKEESVSRIKKALSKI
jgi:glutamyl-tRNA synthetase